MTISGYRRGGNTANLTVGLYDDTCGPDGRRSLGDMARCSLSLGGNRAPRRVGKCYDCFGPLSGWTSWGYHTSGHCVTVDDRISGAFEIMR